MCGGGVTLASTTGVAQRACMDGLVVAVAAPVVVSACVCMALALTHRMEGRAQRAGAGATAVAGCHHGQVGCAVCAVVLGAWGQPFHHHPEGERGAW